MYRMIEDISTSVRSVHRQPVKLQQKKCLQECSRILRVPAKGGLEIRTVWECTYELKKRKEILFLLLSNSHCKGENKKQVITKKGNIQKAGRYMLQLYHSESPLLPHHLPLDTMTFCLLRTRAATWGHDTTEVLWVFGHTWVMRGSPDQDVHWSNLYIQSPEGRGEGSRITVFHFPAKCS